MIKLFRTSGGGIDVFVFSTTNGDPFESSYIGANGAVKKERIKEGQLDLKPYWRFSMLDSDNFLPEFMDALIDFGIKPSKHLLTDEEKNALERHLEDMRTLVFSKEVCKK